MDPAALTTSAVLLRMLFVVTVFVAAAGLVREKQSARIYLAKA
jgi:hypothetical protein